MLTDVLLAFLSALLLVLSFPKFDMAILVWVALVPLLIAIRDKSLKHAFALSFLTGISFFAGVFYWINEVSGFKLADFFPLLAYFGLYFSIFGLGFNFISKKTPFSPIVTAPVLWVSTEYLRSNAGFLGLPCALLGHSQYVQLPIIQICSFTGVYGVSFLIVMTNVAIREVLCSYFCPVHVESIESDNSRKRRRNSTTSFILTLVMLSGTVVYGFWALSENPKAEKLSMTVIQGNIPQEIKWNQAFRKRNFAKHLRLTKEALENDDTSLIVWPETAVPGPFRRDLYLLHSITNLAVETKTHLLIGSSQRPKFGSREFRRKNWFNSGFLISPRGRIEGQYNKIRLMPFGEYLPFEDQLPWPSRLVSKASHYIPGREHTIFHVDDAKFGVLICWENVFPGLVREFVKKGANAMINITNEAWFGETAAPYQFVAMSVFRAVENRVSVARSANTGISCFIDPYGRIMGRVENNNRDIFVEGYLTQEIPLSQKRTFYTIYGDIFAYINLTICVLVLALSFLKIKRE